MLIQKTWTFSRFIKNNYEPNLPIKLILPHVSTRCSKDHHHGFLYSTSSTAYPSGSVRHPTRIVAPPVQVNKQSIPFQHRKLPDLPNKRPLQIGIFILVGSIWITFIQISNNSERFNSSITKQILFEIRNFENVQKFLSSSDNNNQIKNNNGTDIDVGGMDIHPVREGYFNQVWVDGHINLMQGSVDVAFRVAGPSHSGKVYFTSVRRDRQSEFEIIRWKLIRDDGQVLDLMRGKTASVILKEDKPDQVEIRSMINSNSNNNDNHNESDGDALVQLGNGKLDKVKFSQNNSSSARLV